MEKVVLLPGLMCDERLFGPIIKPLKKNYRVYTPVMDRFKSMDEMANFVLNSISGLSYCGFVYGRNYCNDACDKRPKPG